ncbi:MAG: fibronectin type III domain-containing protein, partial [Chloroflexota bacterium]|nr:fibronectin type III domain-containing protein [Chloroflexota bacterium]
MNIAPVNSRHPHRGRRLRVLVYALLALGMSVLLLSPNNTEAQTSVALVGNTGQTLTAASNRTAGYTPSGFWQQAQGFTTGSSGATLTEVDVRLHSDGVKSAATPRVSIYSADGSGNPNSSLYVLTNPSSFTADAVNTFTAPANATLTASTTYFVVVETSATATNNNNQIVLSVTGAQAEDSGGQTGWTIANTRLQKLTADTSWTSGVDLLMVALRGTVATAPSAPSGLTATPGSTRVALSWTDPSDSTITKYQYRVSSDGGTNWSPDWTDITGSGATTTSYTVTGLSASTAYTIELRAVNVGGDGAAASVSATTGASTAFIGNTGQTLTGSAGAGFFTVSIWQQAQGFTTGSTGATLTEVDVRVHSNGVGNAAVPRVSIYSADGSGNPNSSLYVLTSPDSFTADAVNTFIAPANATLTANTTYLVVIETAATAQDTNNQIWLNSTDDDDEDSGGRSGWTIADNRLQKATTATSWSSLANSLVIALRGAAAPAAPSGLAATPGSDEIALSWTDPSDSTITKYQYRVSDDSGSTWSPDWTDIAGSGATTTSYTVTGLSINTPYTIELRAVNATGDGAASSVTSQTLSELVGNIDTSETGEIAFNGDNAQDFTTGGNASGYLLTGVKIPMQLNGTETGYTVSIRSGSPGGTNLGTLTNPASLPTSWTDVSFAASGNGIALSAN